MFDLHDHGHQEGFWKSVENFLAFFGFVFLLYHIHIYFASHVWCSEMKAVCLLQACLWGGGRIRPSVVVCTVLAISKRRLCLSQLRGTSSIQTTAITC